eukprot:Sspe_Gene.33597::Locus_16391_Transcript_1_1_Confidence_1.000_Length_6292::g.33597::m.33597
MAGWALGLLALVAGVVGQCTVPTPDPMMNCFTVNPSSTCPAGGMTPMTTTVCTASPCAGWSCTGSMTATCSMGMFTPAFAPMCTPNNCAPYNLPANQFAQNMMGMDPCMSDNPMLTAAFKQCNIQCANGYGNPAGANVGFLQCNNPNAAGTTVPTPTITCQANLCAAYKLPPGTEGKGTLNPCTDGIRLSTDSTVDPKAPSQCEVQCKKGYGQASMMMPGTPSGKVVCAPMSGAGAAPMADAGTAADAAGCLENVCGAYAFTNGVTGGTTDPCTDMIQLSVESDPSCSLMCDTSQGYMAATATVSCPTTSEHGALPTVTPASFICRVTCQAFVMVTGCMGMRQTPIASPAMKTCGGPNNNDVAMCTDMECCLADCALPTIPMVGGMPAYTTTCMGSIPSGTMCTYTPVPNVDCGTMQVDITCNDGSWNMGLPSCRPKCTMFMCMMGNTLKNNPDTITCTGDPCQEMECCNVPCPAPMPPQVGMTAAVTLTPAACMGNVPHGTTCTFNPVPNVICTRTGDSTCNNGVWQGAWTSSNLPSCDAVCGDTTMAPGHTCMAPLVKKAMPSMIRCPPSGCDDTTCCDQPCTLPTIGSMPAPTTTCMMMTQSGTTCTYDDPVMAICMNTGMSTCTNGKWMGAWDLARIPSCVPTCSSHTCMAGQLKLNAGTIACNMMCDDATCCDAPCTVPANAQVTPSNGGMAQDATQLSPATCMPMMMVNHGTKCTFTAGSSVVCINVGQATCTNGQWVGAWSASNVPDCDPQCGASNMVAMPGAGHVCMAGVKKSGMAAANFRCPKTGCSDADCCDADCTVPAVPQYTAMMMMMAPAMTLSPGTCMAMMPVNHGTRCVFTPVPGVKCINQGESTCNNGQWNGMWSTTNIPSCFPTCAVHTCAMGSVLKDNPDMIDCTTGTCNDGLCCNAPCTLPTAPMTGMAPQATSSCAAMMMIQHGSRCTWTAAPGYVCQNVGDHVCNNGVWDKPAPTCQATCGNGNFAGCAATPGMINKMNFANIVCGPDMMAPADACTDTKCCDTSCAHQGFTCKDGYIKKNSATNTRCGATSMDCTDAVCCDAAPCPDKAGPRGTCDCESGYTPNPAKNWNSAAQMWDHICFATCDNAMGPCSNVMGLLVKDPVPICTGPDPMMNCVVTDCCDATCAHPMFMGCNTMGFRLRSNAGATRCGSSDPTMCTTNECCVASCDNPAFGGCSATSAGTGWLLKPTAAMIECSGSDAGKDCTREICCDATICDNFVCSAGKVKRPDASTVDCKGVPCTDDLCCSENVCAAPGDVKCYTFGGTGGTACTQVSACAPVSCSPGCSGTPSINCPTHMGAFNLTGCTENTCKPPAQRWPGYSPTGGDQCNSVTNCGVFSCATGWTQTDPMVPPTCTCPTLGGDFICKGCTENQCMPPADTFIGYTFAGDTKSCTTASSCLVSGCKPGYIQGTLRMTCPVNRGPFALSGCVPADCPSFAATTSNGICLCQNGYKYNDTLQEPVWDPIGRRWTHKCVQVACPRFAERPPLCTCAQGYKGSPAWDVASGMWVHQCTAVACPNFAEFVCTNNVCSCVCKSGYKTSTGGVVWNPTTQGWEHTCEVVACPPNADGPGVCRCRKGYSWGASGPQWNGVQWTHQCIPISCPANSNPRRKLSDGTFECTCAEGYVASPGVGWDTVNLKWEHDCIPDKQTTPCPEGATGLGVCNCAQGYIIANAAQPTWNGFKWTHTCKRAQCPDFSDFIIDQAQGVAFCVCREGYQGVPSWNGRAWAHRCQVAPCPDNASGVRCPCNMGFIGTAVWANGAWQHTCQAAVCPENAGPPPTCLCNAGYTGERRWGNGQWLHTCAPGGVTPPSACYNGLVNFPRLDLASLSGTAQQSMRAAMREDLQTIYSIPGDGIVMDVSSANGATQLRFGLLSNVWRVTASGINPCNSAWGSTTTTFAQLGGQAASLQRSGCTPVSSACDSTGNIPPTATLSNTRVEASPSNTEVTIPNFLTMVSAGETGQTIAFSCTTGQSNLFANQIQIDNSVAGFGALRFTPIATGQATVKCTLTDNGVPPATTTLADFIIVIGDGLGNGGNDDPCPPSLQCTLSSNLVE